MAQKNDKIKALYEQLKSDGFKLDDEGTFREDLRDDKAFRRQIYDAQRNRGYDMGGNFKAWEGRLMGSFGDSKPKPEAGRQGDAAGGGAGHAAGAGAGHAAGAGGGSSAVGSSAVGVPHGWGKLDTAETVATVANPAERARQGRLRAKAIEGEYLSKGGGASDPHRNLAVGLGKIAADELAIERMARKASRHGLDTAEKRKVYEENRDLMDALSGAPDAAPEAQGKLQAMSEQLRDRLDYMKETGEELKDTALDMTEAGVAPTLARDEAGNILRNEDGRPLMGHTTDETRVDTQREAKIMAERADMRNKIKAAEERIKALEAEARKIESPGYVYAQDALSPFADPATSNGDLQSIRTAIENERQLINGLKRELEGGNKGFLRGLADGLGDKDVWTMGMASLGDKMNAYRVSRQLDEGKKPNSVEEMMLGAMLENESVRQRLDENSTTLYRAGKMMGYQLPFMLQIGLTGGYGAMADIGVEAGKRWAGSFAAKYGSDALAKRLGANFLRATGIALGETAAGAAEAATAGLANTVNDAFSRATGNVSVNEDGEYAFTGGDDFWRAAGKALASQAKEFATEGVGRHLPGMRGANVWVARNVPGARKLSRALSGLAGTKAMRETAKWLRRGGVHGLGGEIIEEEIGLPVDVALGDMTWEDALSGRTQGDIVAGLALSMGAMRGVSLAGYGLARGGEKVGDTLNYGRYSRRADEASRVASERMTESAWLPLKERMDSASNEEMGSVWDSIRDDGKLSAESKRAAYDYMNSLMAMRGYNLGMIHGQREAARRRELFNNLKPTGKGEMGDEYDQFKGNAGDAAAFLTMRRGGVAKGVFKRKGLGAVDLAWGNPKGGLEHIIEKHVITHADFDNVDTAMDAIEDVLRDGELTWERKGERARVEKDGMYVILAKSASGHFVVTAYDKSRPQNEKLRGEADAAQMREMVYGGNGENADQPLFHSMSTTDTSKGAAEGVSAQAVGVPVGKDSENFDAAQAEWEKSYSRGYDATDDVELQDIKNRYGLWSQEASGVLSEETLAMAESDPMGALRGLEADEGRRRALMGYLNAKRAYAGMIQRVKDDMDGRVAESDAMVDSRVNRSTGMLEGVTMKAQGANREDRRAYVTNGRLVALEDGSGIDREKSDGSVAVRYEDTGEVEMVSPDAVLRMEAPVDPEEEKRLAAEAIRQEYGDKEAARIDGQVGFNVGDTYTLTDENGQATQVQVAANKDGVVDNGNGTVNVSSDGGQTVVAMGKEDIQAMVDATNKARVAAEVATEAGAASPAAGASDAEGKTGVSPEAGDVTAGEALDTPWVTVTYRDADGALREGKRVDGNVDYVLLNEDTPEGEREIPHPRGELESQVVRVTDEDGALVWEAEAPRAEAAEDSPAAGTGVSGEGQPSADGGVAAGAMSPEGVATADERLDVIGRSLTEDEAEALVSEMEARAVMAPEVELNSESWLETFGEGNSIETPIGKVKMGEHQLSKFFAKGREKEFGMVGPTLSDPDVILEKDAPSANAERDTKLLFMKTFTKADGSRYVHFESVTVKKDGLEVSISSHEADRRVIKKEMQNGKVLHLKESLSPGSEGYLTRTPRTEGPDLVPAPDNTLPMREDSAKNLNSQGNGSENVSSALSRVPKDEGGQPLYEQVDAETAWDALVEQAGGDAAMASEVAADMVADKEAAVKKLEKAKVKGGATPAEKIAAKLERQKAVEQATADLEHWKTIANTPGRRAQREMAERMKAEEAALAAARERQAMEKAAREEAERVEREALQGVPDMVDDTARAARARGYRRVNGHKVERQEPLRGAAGKDVSVRFSDKVVVPGKVMAIEAGALQPSHVNGQRNPLHFIDEAQPKERKDKASQLAARQMAAEMRPLEITSSATAFTGAPSVNARGEVIQGNNRGAALKEMWAGYPEQAARYKAYLMEHAEELGLDRSAIEAMENPVLVNVMDVTDEDAITLGQYEAQDTESGGVERINAKNVSQKLGERMGDFANVLLRSEDDEASFSELVDRNGVDALRWLNQRGYISATQYQSAFDSKGNVSGEAKNDLRGLLYQGVFRGGSTQLAEMFNALPAKAQKAILATAYRDYDSPATERLLGEIQSSIMAYYALSRDAAFANARNYKEARVAAESWKRQLAFDDVTGESYLPSEKFSNFAVLLATTYKGQTQSFVQNLFNSVYDLVQGTKAASLFEEPDNTPRTLVEAINETVGGLKDILLLNENFRYDGQLRGDLLAVGGEAGQRGRQGGEGSAPAGGRAAEGERRDDGDRGTGVSDNERGGQGDIEDIAGRQHDGLGAKQEAEDLYGRSGRGVQETHEGLSDVEADALMSLMEEAAVETPDMELNPQNWREQFGDDGMVDTPVAKVKMGANQIAKLFEKGRSEQFGMIKPTLEAPLVVIEEQSEANDGLTERPSSLLYVKTFINKNGKKVYYSKSVTVKKDGYEVSVSSHYDRPKRIKEALKRGKLLYRFDGGAQTEHRPVDASVTTSPVAEQGFSVHKDTEKSGAAQGIGEKISEAEGETQTNPTDGQKEAGNYKKGHVRLGRFDVTIENPKGSVRRGVDASGKTWEQTMRNTYGYIRGTEGVDGDHIDVFLADEMDGWEDRPVCVVDQYNEDGTFDEHKVMLGFGSETEARAAYLSNYEEGWEKKRKVVLSSVSLSDFEKWVDSSHRKTKAFAEYKGVKRAGFDVTRLRQEDWKKRKVVNRVIDESVAFITGRSVREARESRLEKEQERRDLAKEIYDSVLRNDFNELTLQRINDYIDDATPQNPFGRRISQRVPQKMERRLHAGPRTNAVDALFTRISESAVGGAGAQLAGNRSLRESAKAKKKELLKGWAIATGHWHVGAGDFTDGNGPISRGRDSDVYYSKDGDSVIKFSRGKGGIRFSSDIDAANLFNFVFPNTSYEILGYGEIDGDFVTILRQPVVDIASALTERERVEYMRSLRFTPQNEDNTAFSNGQLVVSDLQKGNIVRGKDGNIYVIDADVKLHTKDLGGNYTYPPASVDTEKVNESKEITPEQSALLERPNFAQYPTAQESSAGKDSGNIRNSQEIGEKKSGKGEKSVKKGKSAAQVREEPQATHDMMLEKHREVKGKHPGHIVLLRVGDFFETFGEDARVVSKELGVTLGKYKGGESSTYFPADKMDSYMAKLIRSGHKVALVDSLGVNSQIIEGDDEMRNNHKKTTGSLDNGNKALSSRQEDEANGIPERVSQGEHGTLPEEDRRMAEVSDGVARGSRLYEKEHGGGRADVAGLFAEQRAAERLAKENGYWLPMDEMMGMGVPGPSGNENDTYISEGTIYKVNNLLNSGGIVKLFDKVRLHNQLFPNTRYDFVGFTGFDGRSVYPVFSQKMVEGARPASVEAIDRYMSEMGFSKTGDGRYAKDGYEVWDVVPKNVLEDADGNIYVVDAEMALVDSLSPIYEKIFNNIRGNEKENGLVRGAVGQAREEGVSSLQPLGEPGGERPGGGSRLAGEAEHGGSAAPDAGGRLEEREVGDAGSELLRDAEEDFMELLMATKYDVAMVMGSERENEDTLTVDLALNGWQTDLRLFSWEGRKMDEHSVGVEYTRPGMTFEKMEDLVVRYNAHKGKEAVSGDADTPRLVFRTIDDAVDFQSWVMFNYHGDGLGMMGRLTDAYASGEKERIKASEKEVRGFVEMVDDPLILLNTLRSRQDRKMFPGKANDFVRSLCEQRLKALGVAKEAWSPRKATRLKLAKETTDKATLRAMCQDHSPEVVEAVARNPHLNDGTLRLLSRSGVEAARERARNSRVRESRRQEGGLTAEEAALRDAVVARLRESGLEVVTDTAEGQRVLDEANGKDVAMKRKTANNTGLPERDALSKAAVISFADSANIRNNLDKLAKSYENSDRTHTKTLLSELGKAIEAEHKGGSSQYVTIAAKNGNIVTIRLANHNVSVERMDNAGKDNGISIVISRKGNEGIKDGGNAHIIEFFYSDKSLRDSGGKTIAAIARSLRQTFYSGEYKDTTGLAEVQEVNEEKIREHRVYHGSGADFTAFDHSHMGEGEGAQAYGWGSYVTEVEGIGREYAKAATRRVTYKGLSSSQVEDLWVKGVSPYDAAFPVVLQMEKGEDFEKVKSDFEKEWKRKLDGYIHAGNTERAEEYRNILSQLSELREEDFDVNNAYHLYTVEIPDDNGENYLRWEHSFSEKEMDGIARKLKRWYLGSKERLLDDPLYQGVIEAYTGEYPKDRADGERILSSLDKKAYGELLEGVFGHDFKKAYVRTGHDLYSYLTSRRGSDKAASELLSQLGFTGISYPAQYRTGGRSDGARNYVVFKEADLRITDHVRFFRTPQGEAYGFTVGGKIYLDPKVATAETPIHEYAHLWASALRAANPEEWRNIVGLMKGTSAWDEVKRLYPELETDDEVADEVLATYSGRRGAERLREEASRKAEGSGLFGRAEAMGALERVREALRRFWKGVADFLHIHYTTAEEVADRVMGDLLEGVNPVEAAGSVTDGKLMFQLKKPVERKNGLVALHNLSEGNLRSALELGGFPMPSIAITRADMGHTEYGDISLVFGAESVNPTDRRNRIYSGDAWTPTFPEIGFKLNEAKTDEIYSRARKAGSLPFLNPVSFHWDNYERYLDGTGEEGLVERFKNDYGAKQLYLYENGNPVEKMEAHEVEKYAPEEVKTLEKVLAEIGLERLVSGEGEALEADVRSVLAEEGVDFDSMRRSRAKMRVIYTIGHAADYAVNGNRKTEMDLEATKKKIDRRVGKKKFEEWLRDLFGGLVEKRGIRNERDTYTPSGNRRKWERLYDSITLENVMEAMRRQSEKGGQGMFGGNVFGAAQRDITSMEELREAAKSHLAEISHEEYEKNRDEISERLAAVSIPGAGGSVAATIDLVENITEAVKHSHTATGIYKYLKGIYRGMTREVAEEIAGIVKDIQGMSTRYFEAKPYRAVGFEEVKLAVVPRNMDKELVGRLKERGIPVKTYKSGDQENRKKVLNSAAEDEDLLFRAGEEDSRAGTERQLVEAKRMRREFEAKKGRVAKLRESEPVEITGEEIEPSDDLRQYKKNALEYGKRLQGSYVNEDTGETVQLQRGRRNGGVNEVLQHDYKDAEHLQSVAAIPQIIAKGIYIESRENEDKAKNPDVKEYQYFVCGLRIGGEDYTVRSTIAVDTHGNRYYDHKLTAIEKGKLLDLIEGQAVRGEGFGATPGTEPTTHVPKREDKVLRRILQVNDEENAKKIKAATGWELGVDGEWRNGSPYPGEMSVNEEEANDLFRVVDDASEVARLENEPTVKVYRAMSLVDGKLYPPMSKKIGTGSGRVSQAPSEIGQWEVSDERPELVEKEGSHKNHIYIVKDNGKGLWVAYNPYFHTSRNPLNDQFAEAYQRPNLVTVEVEVPASELTSGYRAEGAKDPVGETKWNAGPVNRQLSGEKRRKVILSRWMKPVRIVPEREVAERIAELLEGENVSIPDNTVTPSLLAELRKLGVRITEGIKKKGKRPATLAMEGEGALTDDALSVANEERARMAEAARRLAEKLHLGNVDVVTDTSELTGKRRGAKGFYNKRTGRITIVVPNHSSVSDVVETLLHEAVGHYGLRELFGAHFDTFLDNVYMMAEEDVRRKIVDLSKRHHWDVRTATEEYLASLAERTNFEDVNASWWEKIKSLFMAMLHKIGFEGFGGVTLSDNELRYILWRSYENLAEPGRYKSIFGEAADVAKQYELKVGAYAPTAARNEEAADMLGEEDAELEAVNRRFNEELEAFKENRQKGLLHLGTPGRILRACGINVGMTLSPKVLNRKLKQHGLEVDDIKDLAKAVQSPILVYRHGKNVPNIVVVTDLEAKGGKLSISLELDEAGNVVEINNISSVHNKEASIEIERLGEMDEDTLRKSLLWVDKEKVLDWFGVADLNSPIHTSNPKLNSIANVLNSLESSKDSGEKVEEEGELEAVNRRFNEELESYAEDGTLPKDGRFVLGNPSAELRVSGFPSLPITMRASLLNRKAGMERHPFEPSDLLDLPKALYSPIAVFRYSKPNMRNVIVDLTRNGKHFLVGVTLDYTKGELRVNSVSGLFPKENHEWVKWIQDGKAISIPQKKKVLDLIDSLRTNPEEAKRIGLNLLDVAKIVKDFENPKDSGEKVDEEGDLYRMEDARPINRGEDVEVKRVAREGYEAAVRDTGGKCLLSALLGTWSHEGRVRFKHKFSESFFDYTRSVKALQDSLAKALGRKTRDFENPWQAMNSKSSVDEMEIDEAMFRYVEPLTEHIGKHIAGKRVGKKKIDLDEVEKYLNAKHGLERNAHMAERELSRKVGKELDAFRKRELRELLDEGYQRAEAEAIVEADVEAEESRLREALRGEMRKDYAGLTALFAKETEGSKDVEKLEKAAAEYCQAFEESVGEETADELWRLIGQLNDFTLRKAYVSGLIGKEQYDETRTMYKHYVPLRGWHDDYAGDVYQYISRGSDASALQGVLKKAYGRESRAADILGTMAAMANMAIVQGNRNQVNQKLLNLAHNTREAGLLMVGRQWYEENAAGELVPVFPDLREGMSAEEMQAEIERHEEAMAAKEKSGEGRVVSRTFGKDFPLKVAKWQEKQHMVRVLRNGREYAVYVLGNPRAAQALNGMLNPDEEVSVIEEGIMKWMRFKAQMQTSFSPEFMVSNFQRDTLTSTTGTYIKHGAKTARRFAKNLYRVMPGTPGKGDMPTAGIFALLLKRRKGTLDLGNETERMFDEFVRGGGMTGISRMLGAEEYERKMANAVRHMRMGAADMPRQAWEGFMESVQFLNNGIENATRFAAYMTARQEGKSIGDSVMEAKEVSVNFNMKGNGAWGNLWMRRYILYSNPALQSLRMLGTWYEASPRRFMGVMAGTMALSFAMAMMWWTIGGGDDGDDDNDWYGLSEWNRYNYINVKAGDGYLHWNIPQELRPVWALGQIAFDWQAGRLTTERALHSMAAQLNNLTPVSFIAGGLDSKDSWIESGIKAWTPTIAADFVDAYGWNEDFLGRKITGQEAWNENAPEWQRVTEETPKWAVSLSRIWNESTGGRRNRKSWWDSEYLNPGAVYYLLEQQAGGMGTLLTKCTKLGEQWRSPEEEIELKNVPFVSKFWVTTGDDYSKNRVLNDRFYLKWNEWRLVDYERRKLDREYDDGKVSAEEYDAELKRMEADGSLKLWEDVMDSGLDKEYEELLELSREGDEYAAKELLDVKREFVDLAGEE